MSKSYEPKSYEPKSYCRKMDVDYERPVLKHIVFRKWTEKLVEKKLRNVKVNRERSSKYYGPPELSSVTVPPLFLSFWPPSVDDLIRCQSALPPIFEGSVKDEYLWWLKKV